MEWLAYLLVGMVTALAGYFAGRSYAIRSAPIFGTLIIDGTKDGKDIYTLEIENLDDLELKKQVRLLVHHSKDSSN